MTKEEKEGGVSKKIQEKLDEAGENVEEVVASAKESVAQAQQAMERAKEVLGEGYGALKTKSAEAYAKAKEYLAEARAALEMARERAGELYGRSREVAEEAYQKAKEQYEKLAAELKKGYAKVKARVEEIDVKEMRDDVVEYIRRNPGKSVLLALAVGFVVGFLVRKRDQ